MAIGEHHLTVICKFVNTLFNWSFHKKRGWKDFSGQKLCISLILHIDVLFITFYYDIYMASRQISKAEQFDSLNCLING